MKRGGFLAGFLTCLLLVGVTTTAYAAGIIATPFSELNQRITLNGQEISLTGYNIGGNNYFKLRDIGKEVGFNVSWNGSTRTVEIDTSTSYSEDTPPDDSTCSRYGCDLCPPDRYCPLYSKGG